MPTGFALLAVHLSDGVLTLPWIAGGFVLSGLLVALGVWRLDADSLVRVGLFTAAFFVASQIHLPVGVGSVHLMLNGIVGVVLRRAATLAIAEGLFLQAILFGHGGLYALGVNACVLGLPALFAGYGYPLLRRAARPLGRVAAAVSGAVVGLAASGLTVAGNAAVLAFGGQEDWDTLVRVVVLLHLPVVAVEGLATAVVVSYLERVKPEWLGTPPGIEDYSPSGNTSSNGTSH